MYEAFYGLKERPFNLTPDPKYLYLSDKHKEAFAHLMFGIKNRSGFVMVTGEIGTGKTTICRNLLNQIEPDTRVAFIFNPPLNPVELLKKINVEFGIPHDADNVLELTETLNKFLLEQAAQNHNCVLIIDEAQNLSPLVLEQTRLLSNLETEKDKLLQIVLIGQPELGEKLALHELRQLNQRITARYHLKALSEHETLQYIAYRLHVAGGRRKIQFSKSAVHKIFRASGGTPRVINALCDRALLIGYTKEAVNISAGIINQAASEIRGEKIVLERPLVAFFRRLMPNPSVALIAAVAVFSVWYLGEKFSGSDAIRITLPSQAPKTADNVAAAESKPAPASPPLSAEKQQEAIRSAVVQALADKLAPDTAVAAPASDGSKVLNDALAALTPEAALAGSAESLLAAWGASPVDPALSEAGPDGIEAYFNRQGFATETLMPGFEQLTAIGLPAMVRVKQGPKELWLALLGSKDGKVTLAAGKDKNIDAPASAFKDAYLAEAIIPWKDTDPHAASLSIGRVGKQVTDFKAQLRQLGRLDAANTNELYDQDVARAVSRIQAETGLLIDGVAGRQLRFIMAAWVPTSGTPRLDGQTPQHVVAAPPPPPPVPAPAVNEKPAPVAEKPAPKKHSEHSKSTPLPTAQQLGKALEKAKDEKAAKPAPPSEAPLVAVDTLAKPEAAPAPAPAPPSGEQK